MNPHLLRIDVVKFNGMNNFGMWRCEVMDALTASNLEDTLRLEKKRASTMEEDWDKMNRSACGLIKFNMQSIVFAPNLVFLGNGASTFVRHPHILR